MLLFVGIWKHKEGDFVQLFKSHTKQIGISTATDTQWLPESEFLKLQDLKIYREKELHATDEAFDKHPSYNWNTTPANIVAATMTDRSIKRMASPDGVSVGHKRHFNKIEKMVGDMSQLEKAKTAKVAKLVSKRSRTVEVTLKDFTMPSDFKTNIVKVMPNVKTMLDGATFDNGEMVAWKSGLFYGFGVVATKGNGEQYLEPRDFRDWETVKNIFLPKDVLKEASIQQDRSAQQTALKLRVTYRKIDPSEVENGDYTHILFKINGASQFETIGQVQKRNGKQYLTIKGIDWGVMGQDWYWKTSSQKWKMVKLDKEETTSTVSFGSGLAGEMEMYQPMGAISCQVYKDGKAHKTLSYQVEGGQSYLVGNNRFQVWDTDTEAHHQQCVPVHSRQWMFLPGMNYLRGISFFPEQGVVINHGVEFFVERRPDDETKHESGNQEVWVLKRRNAKNKPGDFVATCVAKFKQRVLCDFQFFDGDVECSKENAQYFWKHPEYPKVPHTKKLIKLHDKDVEANVERDFLAWVKEGDKPQYYHNGNTWQPFPTNVVEANNGEFKELVFVLPMSNGDNWRLRPKDFWVMGGFEAKANRPYWNVMPKFNETVWDIIQQSWKVEDADDEDDDEAEDDEEEGEDGDISMEDEEDT